MLIVCMVERLGMMAPPGLEVGGAPHILLHLLLPVHLGLDHLCLVDDVRYQALALEWAAGRRSTASCWGRRSRTALGLTC